MSEPIYSLEAFKDFAARRSGAYDYDDFHTCACHQYLESVGSSFGKACNGRSGTQAKQFLDEANVLAAEYPRTWEALTQRIKEKLDARGQ